MVDLEKPLMMAVSSQAQEGLRVRVGDSINGGGGHMFEGNGGRKGAAIYKSPGGRLMNQREDREHDGIRSTVPPKRVLQMISERRFHDVLQNYAKVYGDNIFLEGLTEEERMQRREKNWRFGHRRLTLREEMSRAMAVLHLRSVARYDDDKLRVS